MYFDRMCLWGGLERAKAAQMNFWRCRCISSSGSSRDDQNFKAKYDLEYEISPLASPRTTKLTASESHYPELQASSIENHIDVYSHTSKTLRHGKIYHHLK